MCIYMCIYCVVSLFCSTKMNIRDLRAWMYDRKARKYLTPEFLNGVEYFVDVAIHHATSINESLIRCPCKRCRNNYINILWMYGINEMLQLY